MIICEIAQSCPILRDPQTVACQTPLSLDSPGQNTGVGSCSLLQGLFPTQGLNSGFLHCGQILYQLSHQGIGAN